MRGENKQERTVQYYPMFVALNERVCLVVGGGSVGERKIRGLLRSGASVRLVTQNLTPWLDNQRKEGTITLVGNSYGEACLNGVEIVFAATSDAGLNRRIAQDARIRGIWCNMATDPEEGSFIVPSVYQEGPLTIAVSTGGLSPALARIIREKIQSQFGPEWVPFLRLMGLIRAAIKSKGLSSSQNQRIFKEIAILPLPEWIGEMKRDQVVEEIHKICKPWLDSEELTQLWNEVWKPFSLSSQPYATVLEPSDT